MALLPPRPRAAKDAPYRLDYTPVYSALAERGIVLTANEKEKFEHIVPNTINQFAVNQTIGNDFGGFLLKLLTLLIRGAQSFTEVGPGENTSIGTWVSERAGKAIAATNLTMVTQAMAMLHDNLRAEGGNLARAANFITGATVGQGPVVKIPNNVHAQLISQIDGATPALVAESYSLNPLPQRPVYIPSATPRGPVTPIRGA